MAAHELFSYICVESADDAIRYYTDAFGAKETMRLVEPSGRVGHAELELAGTTLMIADPFPEYGVRHANDIGASPVTLHLHVDDTDAVVAKAVELGATVLIEPTDQFYGERSARIRDPFGHEWLIGHSIEDVSHEEMQRRYTALFE